MNIDKYCTLYIVRHGETDWNVKGIIQGHSDIPLNLAGQQQAKEFGRFFKDIHIDAVFSSDLQRAKRTAEIAILEKKMAVQTKEILRERFFGSLEGQHRDEFFKLEAVRQNLTKEEKLLYRSVPDMENEGEVISRVITFLREIAVGYRGKTVLIVSHGGVIRTLLMHLGFAHENNPITVVENTAYVKIRCDGIDFFIEKTKGIRKN